MPPLSVALLGRRGRSRGRLLVGCGWRLPPLGRVGGLPQLGDLLVESLLLRLGLVR